MAVNTAWHAANPLPRGATDAERLRWHQAHEKACGCRPAPASLRDRLEGNGGATKNMAAQRAKSRANGTSKSAATRSKTPLSQSATAQPKTTPSATPRKSPTTPSTARPRCAWASGDPLYQRYHDEEWGTPSHDDRHLFEMLILEGAQAGLSWITILRKRENYRRAFDQFDARKIAEYDRSKVKALLADQGIVRNRLKIESTIDNARAFLAVQKEMGSFDQFVWSFVGAKPLVRDPRSMKDVPASTAESEAMSKAFKKRGFRFVGSTICYAFMQACGLVNDHVRTCFRSPKR
jgi:DNA-3-methyladenine glycosylase I